MHARVQCVPSPLVPSSSRPPNSDTPSSSLRDPAQTPASTPPTPPRPRPAAARPTSRPAPTTVRPRTAGADSSAGSRGAARGRPTERAARPACLLDFPSLSMDLPCRPALASLTLLLVSRLVSAQPPPMRMTPPPPSLLCALPQPSKRAFQRDTDWREEGEGGPLDVCGFRGDREGRLGGGTTCWARVKARGPRASGRSVAGHARPTGRLGRPSCSSLVRSRPPRLDSRREKRARDGPPETSSGRAARVPRLLYSTFAAAAACSSSAARTST